MIELRDITEENFPAVVAMKRPEGENYVAANAYSLAQAWLYRDNGDVFPYAIYDGETPVGFLLLDEDTSERTLRIWRIMFPEEHACKGYGSAAIRLVLERARRMTDKFDVVACDCDPSHTRARHVYEKLGFVATGQINHGSDELVYRLTASA
ncbi:GNAT family N-acetyltransferase [Actinobaculum sp. 352]|uniref:GNAT family N-acetyltransferase n=1 Tax=Actinobaculum sp. 352 TaxID=2490946 RepID=UPI000F7F472B|nr:GNAT family N-acetyltransferase [Actinobaculum sp. 352]RTE49323.1 GNAT family N-acetyltransferase [Actinobaculum sp. 352]